jgi:hypothetical protein
MVESIKMTSSKFKDVIFKIRSHSVRAQNTVIFSRHRSFYPHPQKEMQKARTTKLKIGVVVLVTVGNQRSIQKL